MSEEALISHMRSMSFVVEMMNLDDQVTHNKAPCVGTGEPCIKFFTLCPGLFPCYTSPGHCGIEFFSIDDVAPNIHYDIDTSIHKNGLF